MRPAPEGSARLPPERGASRAPESDGYRSRTVWCRGADLGRRLQYLAIKVPACSVTQEYYREVTSTIGACLCLLIAQLNYSKCSSDYTLRPAPTRVTAELTADEIRNSCTVSSVW